MKETVYDVFISYRRLDDQGNISGRDQARLIAKQLELEGYRAFFDYSEIKDNEFDKVILPAVQNCKCFILVLTKDALNRCYISDDWVRREIEIAINSHCKLINVSPDNSFNGWPATLPQTLYPIRNIQISEINMGSLFEVSIQKLVQDRLAFSLDKSSHRYKETKRHRILVFCLEKSIKVLELVLLLVSISIFCLFILLDWFYNSVYYIVPYYEWLLGAYSVYMILALIGYIKPSFVFCSSRKRVTVFFMVPFILLAIVGGNIVDDYEYDNNKRRTEQAMIPNNNFLDIELNKEMLFVFSGNPHKLVQVSSNMSDSMRYEFDRQGRVISKEFGLVKNVYNWSFDGKMVECNGYNNGKYIGSCMVYIHSLLIDKYLYEVNGTQYEVRFRPNGSLSSITMENGVFSASLIYSYKTEEDKFPYKSEMEGNDQSVTSYFAGLMTDSMGNPVKVIQSTMGQSVSNVYRITYY